MCLQAAISLCCDSVQRVDAIIFVYALESTLKYCRQQISALHMRLPPIASMKSNITDTFINVR